MIKVYVAGAYSADNVLDVLNNIRRGIKLATEVFKEGLAPFCPWLDYHYVFNFEEEYRPSVDMFYNMSIEWLKVSDAVLVVDHPNSAKSFGTKKELECAKKLHIPIFYHLKDLKDWATEQKELSKLKEEIRN